MAKIQIKRDTASNWATANTVLLIGELGYDIDAKQIKIGDGSTGWNGLPYQGQVVSPNVFTTIVTGVGGDIYTDLTITIPRKAGSTIITPPNVRIILQFCDDDGTAGMLEAILATDVDGITTIINSALAGRGQGSENLQWSSSRSEFYAQIVIKHPGYSAPYSNVFVKLESYDPMGVLDMASASVGIESEYASPAPSPIFTV